jgi:hypothetical protein
MSLNIYPPECAVIRARDGMHVAAAAVWRVVTLAAFFVRI